MDNQQALKPTNLFNEFSSVIKEPKKAKEDNTDEERQLAYISRFAGWKLLEEYADRLCEELDNFVTKSIENGADSKEVGERTIAKEIAKAYVKRFVQKVRDSREAVDGRDNG